MQDRQAISLGEALRQRAGWDSPGIASRAIEEFPSSPGTYWIGKQPVLHWIHDDVLVRATASDTEQILTITARPVLSIDWGISASYVYAELGNHVRHQGMEVSWRFEFSEGNDLEIPGEIIYPDGQPTPNDAEKFARALARTMLGSSSADEPA